MDLAMANGDLEAARSGECQALERVLIRLRQDSRCYDGLIIVGAAGSFVLTREAVRSRLHRARAMAREYLDS